VDLDELSVIMADGTGYKRQKGKKAELRSVIGITPAARLNPWAHLPIPSKVTSNRLSKIDLKKPRQPAFLYLRRRARFGGLSGRCGRVSALLMAWPRGVIPFAVGRRTQEKRKPAAHRQAQESDLNRAAARRYMSF